MSIKKYRFCLVLFLLVVLAFGVITFVQMSKEDASYADGIMVQNECELRENIPAEYVQYENEPVGYMQYENEAAGHMQYEYETCKEALL